MSVMVSSGNGGMETREGLGAMLKERFEHSGGDFGGCHKPFIRHIGNSHMENEARAMNTRRRLVLEALFFFVINILLQQLMRQVKFDGLDGFNEKLMENNYNYCSSVKIKNFRLIGSL